MTTTALFTINNLLGTIRELFCKQNDLVKTIYEIIPNIAYTLYGLNKHSERLKYAKSNLRLYICLPYSDVEITFPCYAQKQAMNAIFVFLQIYCITNLFKFVNDVRNNIHLLFFEFTEAVINTSLRKYFKITRWGTRNK